MQVSELNREELELEVARLRGRVEELERREDAFGELLDHLQPHVFSIDVVGDEPHRELYLQPISHEDLPSELHGLVESDQVRTHCLRAVDRGAPEEVELPLSSDDDASWWRLLVIPARDSGGRVDRLLASIQNVSPRRKKQRSVRETRQRYQRLLQLLPDAVTIADEDEHVAYINEAGRTMLGAGSVDDVQGTSIWSLVHPADQAATRRQLERLRRGEPGEVLEVTLLRIDGREVDVEIASVPIVYDGGPAVLITARDLSGRRAMERALTETQELFYKAFHLGPAALAIINLVNDTVVDANEQFERLTGRSREALKFTSVDDLPLWEDRDAYRALTDCVAGQGHCEPVETELRHGDGSRRTALLAAQRIDVHDEDCMLVCGVDITERKRAELAEKESRSMLAKIFQASPAPIVISHLDSGALIDVNEAYLRLMGYSRDELTRPGAQVDQLWIEPDKRVQMVDRLRAQGHVTEEEITLCTKEGEARTMLCSLQQIQVQGEDAILGVLNDITQRKEAEEALREAKLHAEEMERVKTTLLTNLTHEVRTPLTVILGFSSVLREGVRGEYERFVTLIERSGRRLLLMLDAMLDLAQLEAGTLDIDAQPCNAVDVAFEAADNLRPMAEQKELTLKLETPARRAMVRFERDVLNRVLVNLLDNAIKFTEEGQVGLRLDVDEDNVYIAVSDTGVGIEAAFVPHLFDAFAQESSGLERSYQGTGLGLTVSKRIVELGGGTITVDSQKGKGSVFTVVLPLAE